MRNRSGIKVNLEKSTRWPKISKIKFNKDKCKALPRGRRDQILKQKQTVDNKEVKYFERS